MDGREHPDTSDEFDAEVSDVRPRAGGVEAAPARSPLAPRLTPRRRLTRLALVLAAGLALAVVLSSIPAVRDGAAGLASRFLPPPTPTLAPGEDLFYLLPNPPGVDVSLDGHALTHLPFPGDAHPLRLALGHHLFVWLSHIFPFPPANCTISVPLSSVDTCPFLGSQQLPPQDRSLAGRIIATQVSLSALSIPDQDQLTTPLQDALGSIRTTELVQPGEHYYSSAPGATAGSIVVAAQPLRATLSYLSIFQSGYPDPCLVGQPFIPCRTPGEDCSQLCTLPGVPQTAANAPAVWIAGEAVHSTWRCTTLGGQVVADNVGDAFDVQLAVLRITWDGTTWHVTPLLGFTPSLPAADDLVCDPARYWLEQNGRWAFMVADGHPGTAQFVSDATPTDGCLVVLDPQPGSDVPAIFLERFGVLLAVNDAANGPGADLPMADSAEQSLARHLAAQAQLTF